MSKLIVSLCCILLISCSKTAPHPANQLHLGFYELNMKIPELANNLKLRQALSMAIDRESISQQVLHDEADPLYSVVAPTIESQAYANVKYNWSQLSQKKRHALARKLYALAGYSFHHHR